MHGQDTTIPIGADDLLLGSLRYLFGAMHIAQVLLGVG